MDFYAETRAIAEAFVDEGLSSDAEALQAAMAEGATATEILMRIRWLLQQIDRANKTSNLATKRRIDELLKALDAVLS